MGYRSGTLREQRNYLEESFQYSDDERPYLRIEVAEAGRTRLHFDGHDRLAIEGDPHGLGTRRECDGRVDSRPELAIVR